LTPTMPASTAPKGITSTKIKSALKLTPTAKHSTSPTSSALPATAGMILTPEAALPPIVLLSRVPVRNIWAVCVPNASQGHTTISRPTA
jgi:hypothetical protein